MRQFFIGAYLLMCGCKSYSIHTAFTSEVCIKPYKAYLYHTCCDISFVIDKDTYYIPKGFRTDLASIPKIAWPVLAPAHSSLIRPAIAHDWFYKNSKYFTRKRADLILYHMLINDGIGKFRASFIYYAVRMFGWKFYKKDFTNDNGRVGKMD